VDTFGDYPHALCITCYLSVARKTERGPHPHPTPDTLLNAILEAMAEHIESAGRRLPLPNLPADWGTGHGPYRIPGAFLRAHDIPESECPYCNAPVLFLVHEYELPIGMPTEGGIEVWCEVEYELFLAGERYTHSDISGFRMLAGMRIYDACRAAVTERLRGIL